MGLSSSNLMGLRVFQPVSIKNRNLEFFEFLRYDLTFGPSFYQMFAGGGGGATAVGANGGPNSDSGQGGAGGAGAGIPRSLR